MEEIFLDMSLPGFRATEESVKAQGYIEKRYTKSTQKEIEDAYKRVLLKQLVRPNMKPSNVNALKPQINEMIKTTLYESGPGGARVFKFKMFVPGKEVRAQRNAAVLGVEEEAEEESFIHENYGKYLDKVEKAEKAVLEAYADVKNISANNESNIDKAIKASTKAHKIATELLPKLIEVGDPTLVLRGQAALTRSQQLMAYSQGAKRRADAPLEELISHMSKNSIFNRVGNSVINKDFIENIMESEDYNNNNENNENENSKNRNKFYAKALASGMTSSDIKVLRDILKIFTSRGMPKKSAIEMGTLLGNLPREDLKGIIKEVKPVMGKSNDEIAQQLYGYLISKKLGGKRITRRKVIKKRVTRRR